MRMSASSRRHQAIRQTLNTYLHKYCVQPTPHLASTAARMRMRASSRPTTRLPRTWPQLLGATWSSIRMPAKPAWTQSTNLYQAKQAKNIHASTDQRGIVHVVDWSRAGLRYGLPGTCANGKWACKSHKAHAGLRPSMHPQQTAPVNRRGTIRHAATRPSTRSDPTRGTTASGNPATGHPLARSHTRASSARGNPSPDMRQPGTWQSRHVAAQARRSPHLRVAPHGALDVHGVAVPCVAVADNGQRVGGLVDVAALGHGSGGVAEMR